MTTPTTTDPCTWQEPNDCPVHGCANGCDIQQYGTHADDCSLAYKKRPLLRSRLGIPVERGTVDPTALPSGNTDNEHTCHLNEREECRVCDADPDDTEGDGGPPYVCLVNAPGCPPLTGAADLAAARAELAELRERIETLHHGHDPIRLGTDWCENCGEAYPCTTIAALDGAP